MCLSCRKWVGGDDMSAFHDILVPNQFVAATLRHGCVHTTPITQLVRTNVCQYLSLNLLAIPFPYHVVYALCMIVNLLDRKSVV